MPHVLAQDLRNAVLQAAMQGKLTEQLESDGKVDYSLLNTKNYPKLEEELDLPESWINSHLEDVTNSISTKPYQILDSEIKKEGKYPVISQSKQYSIGFSDRDDKVLNNPNKLVAFGDHTTIVKRIDFPFVVGADGIKLFECSKNILPDYLYYCLSFNADQIAEKGGYSRHYKFIKNKSIPLPPIEEQARIVAKVDELMAKIDEYEKIEKELTELQKAFPGNMRESAIKYILEGRLTGYKDCDDRVPIDNDTFSSFEIPEDWDLVPMKDCCYLHARIGWQALTKREHMAKGDYMLVTGTDFKNGEIDYSTCVYVQKDRYDMDPKIQLQNDDILITKDGSIGKVAVVKDLPKPATLNTGVFVVRPDERFDKKYIEYIFSSTYFGRFIDKVKSGTTIKHLNQNKLMEFKIPVPPIEEQQRIVDKLDQLLPLCEQLEKMAA